MKNIKTLFYWLKSIAINRLLIWRLAKNDFKTRYAGNYLGIIWAIVQPLVTIAIYVFVFQFGLKATPVTDVPYVLWLVPGIIIWFFFSDSLNGATNSLLEYSYLVKKVVFKVDILPMVKIISATFVHIIFILIVLILYFILGNGVSLYSIQIIYYSFCTMALAVGISYITSAVVVFFRDMAQIVNIILQFGMWLTPIMWPVDTLGAYQWIMKINPMFYVVNGYRDALIEHRWFWSQPVSTVYFWVTVMVLLFLGITVFKKMEKHFADVL